MDSQEHRDWQLRARADRRGEGQNLSEWRQLRHKLLSLLARVQQDLRERDTANLTEPVNETFVQMPPAPNWPDDQSATELLCGLSSLRMEDLSRLIMPRIQAWRPALGVWVADQLADLPAPYRNVLVLRHVEGLGFEEVARRMSRTPRAIRMLWLRALERVQQLDGREDLP